MPDLPFDDGAFDLALSSHLLFLYSEQFDLGFHVRALEEMLRVAAEVRVFPLSGAGIECCGCGGGEHGDVDRLLDLLTDDVVFMPHNAPSIVGRSAVEQTYRAVFAAFEVEQTFVPEEIQVGGDWAFVRGSSTCNIASATGTACA